MNSFIVSLNVVLPLFLLMLFGFVLRKYNYFDENSTKKINKLCFRFFLPIMLFSNIIESDLHQDFDTSTVFIAIAMSFVFVFITSICAALFEREKRKRASLAQGSFRNNYIMFGIPLMSSIFGPSKVGYISMLIACIIPLNNVLAVIQIKVLLGVSKGYRKVIKEVVTNPFVVAAIIGFSISLLHFDIPTSIKSVTSSISKMAGTLAFIVLGASLDFKSFAEYLKDVVIGSFIKLFVLPFITIFVLYFTNIRNEMLLALVIASATPAASASPIMASEMGADGVLAGHLVVVETALSVLSLFFWIFILKHLALI